MAKSKAPEKPFKRVRERLKHIAWAGAIALVLQLLTLLMPVDQLFWTIQSRLAKIDASGDIVFIGARENLTDPRFPQRRAELAQLITRLDQAGAKDIYVDILFDRESRPEEDAALNAALRGAGGRVFLVESLATDLNGENRLNTSVPAVSSHVSSVRAQLWSDVFGLVWNMPYEVAGKGSKLPTISASIAGARPGEETTHPISYFYNQSSIPTYRFISLQAETSDLRPFAGKSVVIGLIDPPGASRINLPGSTSVAPSLVHIYAAETLKANHTKQVDGLTALLIVIALLALIALLPKRSLRNTASLVLILSLPVAFVALPQAAILLAPSSAIIFLFAYAIYRGRARWRSSFQFVDAATDLPTFAALEADRKVSDMVPAIIVARIHRFEEVRRSLPVELHTEYVLRIIARLSAATQDATIYIGKGNMLAWTMEDTDAAVIKEHLEGLRALFSSPLMVGDNQVDVGITFGVDITPSPNVTRRVAAAVSAAESTNETFDPIAIADKTSDEDLIWNISLQGRIDAALANGEIFLVYQPKVSLQSGQLVGVESLVRWRDPVKGVIAPDQFIRQCENAGRMSHLTRHVLTEACQAGINFAKAGMRVPVAVNISATMLHERAIVTMVRDVLEETGLEPTRLTLEVTETYRINNLGRAAEILGELSALGTKISMDDFGVGAASLEALVRLPFTELKIDRLFVSRMVEDAKALAIVKSVLKLGRESRISVVAEGVETLETLNLLRDSGCLIAQGYGISRPVSFDDILAFQDLKVNQAKTNMV